MQRINDNAAVKCSKTVIIEADSQKVWEVMTNIDNWPTWHTGISTSKLNGALKRKVTFDWKTGGAKIRSTLHTVEPYKLLGWTGKSFGVFAIHNWTFIENRGKTEVFVEESMEGALAILFRKSFNRMLEKGIQKWLELLKQACEKQP